MFHTKFHQNRMINEDFQKIRGGTQNPPLGGSNQKIKDFESSSILLEPACKISKSLKNGKMVFQLAKILSQEKKRP